MRVENSRLLENRLLTLVVAKRLLSEQKFVENDSNGPDVHFVRNLWLVLLEALRSLIPVGAHALGSQLYLLIALFYDLTQAKVCDLDLALVENDVLWF